MQGKCLKLQGCLIKSRDTVKEFKKNIIANTFIILNNNNYYEAFVCYYQLRQFSLQYK